MVKACSKLCKVTLKSESSIPSHSSFCRTLGPFTRAYAKMDEKRPGVLKFSICQAYHNRHWSGGLEEVMGFLDGTPGWLRFKDIFH